MYRSTINVAFLALFFITTSVLFSGQYYAAEKTAQKHQQIVTLTVNINNASAEELADILTGVGLNKAKTIVAYREKIGSFKTIDDLLGVKGIGPATIEKNRHKLKL